MFKKLFSDVFFYITVATVAVATLPQLSGILPEVVIKVSVIVLGAVLLGIKMYQTKQAYNDGVNGVVGSKYK